MPCHTIPSWAIRDICRLLPEFGQCTADTDLVCHACHDTKHDIIFLVDVGLSMRSKMVYVRDFIKATISQLKVDVDSAYVSKGSSSNGNGNNDEPAPYGNDDLDGTGSDDGNYGYDADSTTTTTTTTTANAANNTTTAVTPNNTTNTANTTNIALPTGGNSSGSGFGIGIGSGSGLGIDIALELEEMLRSIMVFEAKLFGQETDEDLTRVVEELKASEQDIQDASTMLEQYRSAEQGAGTGSTLTHEHHRAILIAEIFTVMIAQFPVKRVVQSINVLKDGEEPPTIEDLENIKSSLRLGGRHVASTTTTTTTTTTTQRGRDRRDETTTNTTRTSTTTTTTTTAAVTTTTTTTAEATATTTTTTTAEATVTNTTTTTPTTTRVEDCAYIFSDCTTACEEGAARLINVTRFNSTGGKPCPLQADVPACQPGDGLCQTTTTTTTTTTAKLKKITSTTTTTTVPTVTLQCNAVGGLVSVIQPTGDDNGDGRSSCAVLAEEGHSLNRLAAACLTSAARASADHVLTMWWTCADHVLTMC